MGFKFFSKNKNTNNEENVTASFFKKIALNPKAQPNRSIAHGLSDPDFGLDRNHTFDSLPNDISFTAKAPDDHAMPQFAMNNDTHTVANPAENSLNTLKSNEPKAPVDNISKQNDDKYYSYQGNESFLNEEGRDSDHLYIGPGEPLVPQKQPKTDVNKENSKNSAGQTDNVSAPLNSEPQTIVTGNVSHAKSDIPAPSDPIKGPENIYPAPGQSLASFEKEKLMALSKAKALKEEKEAEKKEQSQSLNQNENAPSDNQTHLQSQASINKVPENVTNEEPKVQVSQFTNPQELFANVKKTSFEVPKEETPDQNEYRDVKLSSFLLFTLFVRKFFASFFTFTTLGALFSKQSLRYLGISTPCFMPIPYFMVGFLVSGISILVSYKTNSLFASRIALLVYILLLGSLSFGGICKMLTALLIRKMDICTKSLIVIVFCLIYVSCFETYYEIFKPDMTIALAYAVMSMLSALAATSLNFGENDDPISSYGTLGGKALIGVSVFCLAITFIILDWQIAVSMIGICILSRVLVGQFLRAKSLSSSTSIVCATAAITLILLMIDLIFVGQSLPVLNESLFGVN